ncbi:MAG: hypothetical protein K0Q73_8484 [Paenibacillus sp.]|jgi:hypothetical protein|nr:hypothetical protein [Paenibacillus sp.]
MIDATAVTCPICRMNNKCGVTAGMPEGGKCWCMEGPRFPKEIFELIAAEERGKSCICKDCLDKFNSARMDTEVER